MVYEIWWNGECVDTAYTLEDAQYLRNEYAMAFRGRVTIKTVRDDI